MDDTGSLFVFLIKDEKNMDSALQYEPILQISRTEEASDKIHRIIWCPYLIEDEQEDETAEGSPSKLLVLIHGSQAEMLNVSIVSVFLLTSRSLFFSTQQQLTGQHPSIWFDIYD